MTSKFGKNLGRIITFTLIILLAWHNSYMQVNNSPEGTKKTEQPFKLCSQNLFNEKQIELVASDNNFENVIFTIRNKTIISYNFITKSENWKLDVGGNLELIEITEKNDIYILTTVQTNEKRLFFLASISFKTGIANWQKEIDLDSIYKIKQKDGYIIITAGKKIIFLDKMNGAYISEILISNNIEHIYFDSDGDLNVFSNETVSKISLTELRILKVRDLQKDLLGKTQKTLFNNGRIFVGKTSGEILALNSNDYSKIWKFKAGASISSLQVYKEYLIVSSFDNFLYLLNTENGQIKWKKRFNERINIEPYIKNNSVAVTSLVNDSVYILDLNDGKTINQIKLQDNFVNGKNILGENQLLIQTQKGIFIFSQNECI